MKSIGFFFLWGCSAALAQETIPAPGKTSAQEATVTIDAANKVGAVNERIFGSNIEGGDGRGLYFPFNGRAFNANNTIRGEGTWDPQTKAPVPGIVDFSKDLGFSVYRYPGGCEVHGYDWKKTVGPVADRPEWQYGLGEFLAFCHDTGAEPLMQVADYTGTKEDAADLVDYLNSPATPGHPWAMKRAAWGHPDPYHVRFFELGNESDHGNHQQLPPKHFTADEYADWALSYIAAMKQVDPSIQIGVLSATDLDPCDPWNKVVYSKAGPAADFIVDHTYPVGVYQEGQQIDGEHLAQALMAGGPQAEFRLSRYRAEIRKYTGKDLPLAITEYNSGGMAQTPIPFRFTYAVALFDADYLRILMKPETNVLMANYWQAFNGYWGLLKTNGPWREMPMASLFRLWHHHFGSTLVDTQTQTPRRDLDEAYPPPQNLAWPAKDDDAFALPPTTPTAASLFIAARDARPGEGDNYSAKWDDQGVLTVDFKNVTHNINPNVGEIEVSDSDFPPHTALSLSFEAKVQFSRGGPQDASLGVGVEDSRGYKTTQSSAGINQVHTPEWQTYSSSLTNSRLFPFPGAQSLLVKVHVLTQGQPVDGELQVRNIQLQPLSMLGQAPAYPLVTSAASLSDDGKKLYIIAFNKSTDTDITTDFNLKNFQGASAKLWQVTGPLMETNIHGTVVKETTSGDPVPVAANHFQLTLPAHSMSAIEVSP